MAPVKFDDIAKVATGVLNDDYQTSGYQIQAKQKTNFNGAIATTAVDLWTKDAVTPTKITWKIPKPFGVAGLSIDKLEMDKTGKFAFEATADKDSHKVDNLSILAKSDLVDPAKISACLTFTGIQNTQIKFDTKAVNPADFTMEVTHSMQQITAGVKLTAATMTAPDVGVRFASGDIFAALVAKQKFGHFSVFGAYKVRGDLMAAATVEQNVAKKEAIKYTAALAYDVQKGTKVKVKFAQDMSVCASVKHDLAKGFTVLKGVKYETKTGKCSYGVKLTIE